MKQKWNRSEGWGIVAARRVVAGLLGVALLALVAGCDQAASDSGPAAIEVEYVAWIFENIAPSYWSTTTDASAFGNFTIYLKTDCNHPAFCAGDNLAPSRLLAFR